MRELLPQAEVYIYENAEKVQSIIGLDGKHIEGTFEKRKTRALSECVPENTQAIYFYQREGFKIRHEGFDEAAGVLMHIAFKRRLVFSRFPV